MADPADVAARRVRPRVDAADAVTLRLTVDILGEGGWIATLKLPLPEEGVRWCCFNRRLAEQNMIHLGEMKIDEIRESRSHGLIDQNQPVMPGTYWVYLSPLSIVEIRICMDGLHLCTLKKTCPEDGETWTDWFTILQDEGVISRKCDMGVLWKFPRIIDASEVVTAGIYYMDLVPGDSESMSETSSETSSETRVPDDNVIDEDPEA
jgi:hypothetical protein